MCVRLICVKNGTLDLKRELARYARKAAEDKLTIATSGNISGRKADRIYIKAQGVAFQNARPSDFVWLDIDRPSVKRQIPRPSYEYRFHIACYKRRPEVKAVLHTHPLTVTTLYSAGVNMRPITLEFALYIGKGIATINFVPPGTKELARAIRNAIADHDAVVMKKHGLVTVGKSLQDAYLKTLIIEREARAQFICRLFKRPPPFLSKEEIASIGAV